MSDYVPTTLHDYLLNALANLNDARQKILTESVAHRTASLNSIAEAEKDIAHVLNLIHAKVPS